MTRTQSFFRHIWPQYQRWLTGLLLFGVALVVRLTFWQWHEFRPLGGDEQEYLAQAVHWLQTREYRELQFMRPPLYTVFLSGSIVLVDSLVQSLRLVQVILSATLVFPVYGLTWSLWRSHRVATVAGLLVALDALVAAVATELLSETLFLWGMSFVIWGIIAVAQSQGRRRLGLAVAVGAGIGALALTRSVALPLAGLAGAWLLANAVWRTPRGQWWSHMQAVLVMTVAALCVVLPWSARNTMTYGGFILIDTTGAENIWLDNEPQGREYAKTILYGMGDDRYGRQRLASARGVASIVADPLAFIQKMRHETGNFFRLTGFDDFATRRAIWVSPGELWSTLLLGDGLWLLLVGAGVLGLWTAPRGNMQVDWRWVVVAWLLYGVLTVAIFHYEPRYRLVVYPVLWSYAAWWLCHIRLPQARWRLAASMLVLGVLLGLTLRTTNYVAESWRLANKHIRLAQAESALADGDLARAEQLAWHVLEWDPPSALAYTLLAQVQLRQQQPAQAVALLDTALEHVPDHPWATVLRGVAYRELANVSAARRDFLAESSTRQDIQRQLWQFMPQIATAPTALELGQGADLGWIWGFYPPESDGGRWSGATAHMRVSVPASATHVRIWLASRRPDGATPLTATVVIADARQYIDVPTELTAVDIAVPTDSRGQMLEITVIVEPFYPRTYDPQSADGRSLGVWVQGITTVQFPSE